jgi:O-antigen/teichoic acid export membrane protein
MESRVSLDTRRLLRNVGSTTSLRIASALVSFAVFVFLARHWPQSVLGEFTTLLAYHTILMQMPMLGLHVPLVRDIVQRPEILDDVVVNSTVLTLVVSCVLALIVGIIGQLGYPVSMRPAFWLVGLSLLPSALVCVAETVLIARERIGFIALINGLEVVFRAVGWTVVIAAGGGLTAAAWVLVAGRVGAVVAYAVAGGIRPAVRLDRMSAGTLRWMLALVPTFFGIHLVTALLSRIDFVALSVIGTLDDVGMYSAPYKLYESAMMLPNIVVVVLYPPLARLFGGEEGQFEALARQLCRACLLIGLPCSVGLALMAEPLIVALYGQRFASAAPVLVLLAFVPPLIAMDYVFAISLHASHKQSRDLRVWLGALATYVVALVLFVPRFGYVGAAVATGLTGVAQVTARYYVVRREIGFAGMAGLLAPPVVAAVVMGLVAVGTSSQLPRAFALLTAGAAYAAVLIAIRGVTAAELRLLRGVLVPAPRVSP